MKITLQNGTVVEGTFDELTQAGFLPARTMSSLALKPQLDLFQVELNTITEQSEPKSAPAVSAEPAVADPKTGRPFSGLTIKIHDALSKVTKTGNEQRVPVASKDELKVRQVVTRFNRVNKTKIHVNKIRVGDRIAMIISQ